MLNILLKQISYILLIINKAFSQINSNRLLYLVTFFFRNFTLANYNYKIYYKKLFAIIINFE